jgi:hypothetical protein
MPWRSLHRVFPTVIKTRDAPDTVFAGYPAGRISGYSKSRIPDIRTDTWLDKNIIGKYQVIFFLALFEEKLNKLLVQLNISRISGRISGIRPYRQGNLVSGRIPDLKKAGFSGRISGASLFFQNIHKCLGFKRKKS